MKKSILAVAVILAFSLAAVAQSSYGGSSSQSQSSAQPSSSAQSDSSMNKGQSDMDKTKTSTGKEKGITGCLEQGTSPGSYLIKDKKHPEGVQVSYSGSEDLSKHVGHKVHATGTMSGGTLNATNVKHISETCNVSGEASTGKHHHGAEAGTETGTGTNPSSGTQNPK